MFGFRKEFQYLECSACGCLQIAEYPADISNYYPPNYYSFHLPVARINKTWWKKYKLALKLFLPQRMRSTTMGAWMVNCHAKTSYDILDIGCGKGRLICNLYNLGFDHVQGIDKYLPEEIDYGHGVKVLNKDLSCLPPDTYDILMMHHVLEHMENQLNVLKECYRLLRKGRYLLIRIPVKSYAWEKYNTDWVQIDAPRHYYIHTVESMKNLVSKTDFKINRIEFDSTGFQFWGSEQYKKGIPLMAPDSYFIDPANSFFSEKEIREFDNEAKNLNLHSKGDQAVFYLYKA